ncbi:nitrilase-related carbon-nitrogen hydrolase [Sodalis endosymbiont of Spalangia cameroni]|uniref:nitrilase-related carbon-nitrogen hydrolase n=1 Tax=Sodalis praecaptivus TaxID=1239307 RepID=UPI0031F8073D
MIKIALAQIDTELGNKRKNLRYIASLCKEAADNKADVICFPELATTGYTPDLLGTRLWQLSESRGEETDRLLSELAGKLGLIIIAGFIERGERTGQVYNSAGVWTPEGESWLHAQRKIHLWADEKKWFSEGNRCEVITTSLGKLGVMVCYDLGFPEVARIFALRQVDILFVIAAWSEAEAYIWDINCAARALENGVFLVAVNRWGEEGELHLFGGSQIMAPDGQRVVRATDKGEALIYGNIDLTQLATVRMILPYRKDLKIPFYQHHYNED